MCLVVHITKWYGVLGDTGRGGLKWILEAVGEDTDSSSDDKHDNCRVFVNMPILFRIP